MNRNGGRKLTIMVMPDGGPESRTFHIPYKWLKVLAAGASGLAFVLTVMAGSWWYLAARASRVADLEFQLEAVDGDRARVQTLARQLKSIEAQYGNIRDLFGAAGSGTESLTAAPTLNRLHFRSTPNSASLGVPPGHCSGSTVEEKMRRARMWPPSCSFAMISFCVKSLTGPTL